MLRMSRTQIAFAVSMALVPLVLFLAMAGLACVRVFIARCLPDCFITRLLLARVDNAGNRKGDPSGVGRGSGDFWTELTYEFRALYK